MTESMQKGSGGMKIAVSGGTGFIGGHLVRYLRERGDEVVVVSRSGGSDSGTPQSVAGALRVSWAQLEREPQLLEGLDAFVNLAGESINQRWTTAAKERILESRLSAAQSVARLVSRLRDKPAVVVNGSGMSVYGASEQATFDESSPAQTSDFLGRVVTQWERAADAIAGCRVVKLRIGLVLGAGGGALPKMVLPYRLFVGGRIGSGRQPISWIHIDDMVRLIDYCIRHDAIVGPVNATAPEPVTNDAFGRTIGRMLHRPHALPLPAAALRLLLGEMASLLLDGQRVLPRKLLDAGFVFRFATLEPALRDVLPERR